MHFHILALASLVVSAHVPSRSPSVLEVGLQQKIPNSLKKRYDSEQLINRGALYTLTLALGSEGTEIEFMADTGSPDTWVTSDLFNGTESTSWIDLDKAFLSMYGSGNVVQGEFGTDNIAMGDQKIEQLQFAVVSHQSEAQPVSLLGLGMPTLEAQSSHNFATGEIGNTYPNFPQTLKDQGVTQSVSYSLWLNGVDGPPGSIVFGGVDHAKYVGTMAKVPLVNVVEFVLENDTPALFKPAKPNQFTVVLSGISVTNSNNQSQKIVQCASLPVLLDSGSSFTYLPPDWCDTIAASVGAEYDNNTGLYLLKGAIQGGITFTFSGVPIEVPFSVFTGTVAGNSGETNYVLGLQRGNLDPTVTGAVLDDGNSYILGLTFLAAAYVIFDIDNVEIGLAQALIDSDTTESNIETIGADGIPSATQAPYYSATWTDTQYFLSSATGLF